MHRQAEQTVHTVLGVKTDVTAMVYVYALSGSQMVESSIDMASTGGSIDTTSSVTA